MCFMPLPKTLITFNYFMCFMSLPKTLIGERNSRSNSTFIRCSCSMSAWNRTLLYSPLHRFLRSLNYHITRLPWGCVASRQSISGSRGGLKEQSPAGTPRSGSSKRRRTFSWSPRASGRQRFLDSKSAAFIDQLHIIRTFFRLRSPGHKTAFCTVHIAPNDPVTGLATLLRPPQWQIYCTDNCDNTVHTSLISTLRTFRTNQVSHCCLVHYSGFYCLTHSWLCPCHYSVRRRPHQ